MVTSRRRGCDLRREKISHRRSHARIQDLFPHGPRTVLLQSSHLYLERFWTDRALSCTLSLPTSTRLTAVETTWSTNRLGVHLDQLLTLDASAELSLPGDLAVQT